MFCSYTIKLFRKILANNERKVVDEMGRLWYCLLVGTVTMNDASHPKSLIKMTIYIHPTAMVVVHLALFLKYVLQWTIGHDTMGADEAS